MLFSVIYEFDCPMDKPVREYSPSQRHLFNLTERSDGEPSDWCGELWDGKVKHRKFCAILTREQFERFLSDTGLFPEDVRTGGSLGAPGFGFGMAPAISFHNDDPDAIQSAYVTPIPLARKLSDLDSDRPKRTARGGFSESDWERVRTAVIRHYR